MFSRIAEKVERERQTERERHREGETQRRWHH